MSADLSLQVLKKRGFRILQGGFLAVGSQKSCEPAIIRMESNKQPECKYQHSVEPLCEPICFNQLLRRVAIHRALHNNAVSHDDGPLPGARSRKARTITMGRTGNGNQSLRLCAISRKHVALMASFPSLC